MLKAIFFDLDGTLIESTRELHFEALNKALEKISKKYLITKEEQDSIFEGRWEEEADDLRRPLSVPPSRPEGSWRCTRL